MIPIDLAGKTVLITGCDSPETARAAETFARAGADLALQYEKDEVSARYLVERITQAGGRAEAFRAELGEYRNAVSLTDKIIEVYKAIDVLVSGALHSPQIPFRELSLEQWNESLQRNLFRVFHISSCVSRLMAKQGQGVIINITSAIHFSGLGGGTDFSAAEAAVHGATLAMARELGPKGVRVNAIAPADRLFEDQDTVGNFAVFLASTLADGISGEIFKLDGFPVRKGGWLNEHI